MFLVKIGDFQIYVTICVTTILKQSEQRVNQ